VQLALNDNKQKMNDCQVIFVWDRHFLKGAEQLNSYKKLIVFGAQMTSIRAQFVLPFK